MAVAFNLSLSSCRTQVNRIQAVRPFPEISFDKLKQEIPYEEFWLTDYELSHLNEDWANRDGAIEDIMFEGLGFAKSPSINHPVLL